MWLLDGRTEKELVRATVEFLESSGPPHPREIVKLLRLVELPGRHAKGQRRYRLTPTQLVSVLLAKRAKALGRRVLFRESGWEKVLNGWGGPRAGALSAALAVSLEKGGSVRVGIDTASAAYVEVAIALGLWLMEKPGVRKRYVRQCKFVDCRKWFIERSRRGHPLDYCPGADHQEQANRIATHPNWKADSRRGAQRGLMGKYTKPI